VSQAAGARSALHFRALDSTNEEAQRQLAAGAAGPLWIVADEQTQGRGRGGRRWQSPKGNLYASLLLTLDVNPPVATQLSFVAALAAHDAVSKHLGSDPRETLRLKWPNDVLLGNAKLAGVLIESAASPRSPGLAVIVGIGINISAAPADTDRAVASLGLAPGACESAFDALADGFDLWFARWDSGRGFATIREAWLARAMALNEPISVNLNGSSIRGTFRGVDHAGALQLETGPGTVIIVNAGEIYPDSQADDSSRLHP
jgi:BirA family transcriptional regulator, biotin operon repressor / biotin---[acetyl-CoA-carboxylase] ligase